MRKISVMLLSVLIGTSIPHPSVAADSATSAQASEVVQATVTVQSVDVRNKKLTVKDDKGVVQTINMPGTIKSLAELKKGDRVRLTYVQAVAADIRKPGDTSVSIETKESGAAAQPGEKPGGSARRQTKGTVTIQNVDPEKNVLTFVGPKGQVRTITVKKPELQTYLKKLKPGDVVDVTYDEALAVEVEPAKS